MSFVPRETPLWLFRSVGRWGSSSYEHMRGDFTESKWQNECALIRNFINNRQSIAVAQLLSYFGTTESSLAHLSARSVVVSFPSAHSTVAINGEYVCSGEVLFWGTESTMTLDVVATPKEGYEIVSITFVDESGSTQTVTGGSGNIRARRPGVIKVETRRVS